MKDLNEGLLQLELVVDNDGLNVFDWNEVSKLYKVYEIKKDEEFKIHLEVINNAIWDTDNLGVLICTIPLFDALRFKMIEMNCRKTFLNISEMQRMFQVMENTVKSAKQENKVEELANNLAELTYSQMNNRETFVFKYNRDAKRLYRNVFKHIITTTEHIAKNKKIDNLTALKFLYFLWSEYATTPTNVEESTINVYFKEFSVFVRQL